MRQFSSVLLILTTLSTLPACSNTHTATTAAGQTTHSDLDLKPNTGGQPGEIDIRGSLITKQGKPSPAMQLRRAVGIDLNGKSGPLESKTDVRMSLDLKPDDVKDLAALGTPGDFAQFGCPDNFHEDTLGRKILRVPEGAALDVRADLVIFCGDVSLEDVKVVANRVIMIDARLKVIGTSTAKLSILTRELSLRGVNTLVTKGRDNMVPFGAPGVTVVADHVQGLGRVSVESEGANWVKAEAK